jgi:uncharacterized membrane protein YsdA (DUF1294 family)
MIWITGWYLTVSLFTFGVYGLDKRKAKLGRWRIKENTLHVLELIGGWPGAFVAQRYFHHKSKKTNFLIVFWVIVTLHVAVWTLWICHRLQ